MIARARLPPGMRFEVEVYKNEAGEWVAEAIEYKVTATGRTESEALARMMDALNAHFKTSARRAR
jgi:predicted RNase H-like HicB family nuclease